MTIERDNITARINALRSHPFAHRSLNRDMLGDVRALLETLPVFKSEEMEAGD